jgi:mannose-6-phosphate isomerase-like protein (cupin superfamily)
MTRRTGGVSLGAMISLTVFAVTPSKAQPKVGAASEAQQAAKAIESALQKHGPDVHACFAKVLADRLDVAGKVEIAVEVGKGGKVRTAKVGKTDKSAGPVLAACIEKAAQGWTIDGIEAGATLVLPFVFKSQRNQYVVNAADVPDSNLGAPSAGKARKAPKRKAPFTVKVLADEQNVRAQGISLTLLSVGPASRVAMHRHPHSAKILYLVKGHARLLGPQGVAPHKLEEGEGVYVPAGYPLVIENMGRQSTGVFLQAFSPPGPERVYRNPKDARGRAEFEVIRNPASAKATDSHLTSGTLAESKPVALPGNAGTVKTLVQGPAMSLSVLELVDGAQVQASAGRLGTELLYFVSGGGTLKVAGETLPVVAESVLAVPRGTSYALKAASAEKNEPIVVVQFKVTGPAGKSTSAPPAQAPRK